MNGFEYLRADSLSAAVGALAQPGAAIIAGGTNLVDLMKYGVEQPTRLVDVTQIAELSGMSATDGGGLRIGALVANADVADDERVRREYPLLAAALLAGATPQLRNAASTGGNLNQRTRCYYFYDVGAPCNKRQPGTGCPAKDGVNRIHAILGASEQCIATHPSDMCVALAALEATVHVQGPRGARVIPFADYHRLPGDDPARDTTRADDEIVVAVELPAPVDGFRRHYTYLKLRDRLSYAFALVSVAVALDIEAGGVVRKARIALGGVAHKPWRLEQAERLLEGERGDEATFAQVADALLDGARGHGDNDFKIELARRAIARALAQAVAGEPQNNVDKRIR